MTTENQTNNKTPYERDIVYPKTKGVLDEEMTFQEVSSFGIHSKVNDAYVNGKGFDHRSETEFKHGFKHSINVNQIERGGANYQNSAKLVFDYYYDQFKMNEKHQMLGTHAKTFEGFRDYFMTDGNSGITRFMVEEHEKMGVPLLNGANKNQFLHNLTVGMVISEHASENAQVRKKWGAKGKEERYFSEQLSIVLEKDGKKHIAEMTPEGMKVTEASEWLAQKEKEGRLNDLTAGLPFIRDQQEAALLKREEVILAKQQKEQNTIDTVQEGKEVDFTNQETITVNPKVDEAIAQKERNIEEPKVEKVEGKQVDFTNQETITVNPKVDEAIAQKERNIEEPEVEKVEGKQVDFTNQETITVNPKVDEAIAQKERNIEEPKVEKVEKKDVDPTNQEDVKTNPTIVSEAINEMKNVAPTAVGIASIASIVEKAVATAQNTVEKQEVVEKSVEKTVEQKQVAEPVVEEKQTKGTKEEILAMLNDLNLQAKANEEKIANLEAKRDSMLNKSKSEDLSQAVGTLLNTQQPTTLGYQRSLYGENLNEYGKVVPMQSFSEEKPRMP